MKARGRTLKSLSYIQRSTVTVKSRSNCLAHALIIAIAKVTNDPDYKAYIKGRKLEKERKSTYLEQPE